MKIAWRSATILFILLSAAAAARGSDDAVEARVFYEKVVKAQPANANAHFDLGNVYLQEKRYSDALGQYEKVGKPVALAASRMDSYYFNKAICYAGLDRMADAVRSLEDCLKVNPKNQEAESLLEIYKEKTEIVLSPPAQNETGGGTPP